MNNFTLVTHLIILGICWSKTEFCSLFGWNTEHWTIMVKRRNLGFMKKFIAVAKLLSSCTVRKWWCRKLMVRDFAPGRKFSVFHLNLKLHESWCPRGIHPQRMYATYSDCSCLREIKFITIWSFTTLLWIFGTNIWLIWHVINYTIQDLQKKLHFNVKASSLSAKTLRSWINYITLSNSAHALYWAEHRIP